MKHQNGTLSIVDYISKVSCMVEKFLVLRQEIHDLKERYNACHRNVHRQSFNPFNYIAVKEVERMYRG